MTLVVFTTNDRKNPGYYYFFDQGSIKFSILDFGIDSNSNKN